jgi:hypothetical protein
MPDKGDRTKPKYEPPALVPLGELAKGSGDCLLGSQVSNDCTVGSAAPGAICVTGTGATVTCVSGSADV